MEHVTTCSFSLHLATSAQRAAVWQGLKDLGFWRDEPAEGGGYIGHLETVCWRDSVGNPSLVSDALKYRIVQLIEAAGVSTFKLYLCGGSRASLRLFQRGYPIAEYSYDRRGTLETLAANPFGSYLGGL